MFSITPVAGVRLLGTNLNLRVALGVAALLSLGAVFSLLNVNLVRSADAAITVAEIDQPVPAADPLAAVWERAPLAEIPLSAQQIWQPGGGSVGGVEVRALHDGERMAIRVSWADDTLNDNVVAQPSDAAAVQLPMDPHHIPYQCMGQSTNPVNIWQWRAALEANAKASEGAIPFNGTRNLVSHGLGKAGDVQGIQPVANSAWRDGRWHVVFSRALAPHGPGTAPLLPGETTNAAFAIWDGSKGETRAMKAVSTWTPLTLAGTEASPVRDLLMMGAFVVLSVAAVALGYRFLPR